MSILGIFLFILFGLVVGLLARALMPGRQSMSLVMTTLLGVAGSLIGGLVVSLLAGGGRADGDWFHPAGFIGSLIGAFALLGIYMAATRRRRVLP
jgi:uncharacterized membrane protein YeaQ/YmgE (transglycosylase-associated protein family)